jgi:hypothetical protein
LVGGFWRGGEGILLVNCIWFIFLRREEEGMGGERREYKTIFASPQIEGIWREGEVRED